MTREKSRLIVGKYLPDVNDKRIEKFLNEVENNSYAKNEFFYRNPLLLSILIVTYNQSCEIPNQSYLFYKNAFDELYQKHDSQKGWFERKRHFDGSKKKLENLFGALSLLTYLDNKYHFKSEKEIKAYMRDAFKLTKTRNGSTINLLKELVENCSMLIFEGQEIKYVHKSFQEYFAAQYLLDNTMDLRKEVSSNFILPRDENLLRFMYEINLEQMETEFSRVKLNSLLSSEYEMVEPKIAYKNYVVKTHSEIMLGLGFYSFPYNYDSEGRFLPFVYDYYSSEHPNQLKSIQSINDEFDIDSQEYLAEQVIEKYSKKFDLHPFGMYLENDDEPLLEGYRLDIKNIMRDDSIYELFIKLVNTEYQMFDGLLTLKKQFAKFDINKKKLVSSILDKYTKDQLRRC